MQARFQLHSSPWLLLESKIVSFQHWTPGFETASWNNQLAFCLHGPFLRCLWSVQEFSLWERKGLCSLTSCWLLLFHQQRVRALYHLLVFPFLCHSRSFCLLWQNQISSSLDRIRHLHEQIIHYCDQSHFWYHQYFHWRTLLIIYYRVKMIAH